MSNQLTSKPDHSEQIISQVTGLPSVRFQLYLDDIQQKLNQILLGDAIIMPEYDVATVPAAADNINGAIIVDDETGGRTIATSDGTNWRRVSDGAIVS